MRLLTNPVKKGLHLPEIINLSAMEEFLSRCGKIPEIRYQQHITHKLDTFVVHEHL